MSKILLFSILILSTSAFSRAPAVEDFVGIEPEDYQITTPGTETLYDFNNQLQNYDNEIGTSYSENAITFTVLGFFILIPSLMWLGMRSKQNNINSDNVTSLENYKKSKAPENNKKAS
jgi:hypothetical protein